MRLSIHPRNITSDDDLRVRLVESLESALGPVGSRLDGIDVYLTDVNGPKGGPDKRCRIVARLPSGRPIVVTRTRRDPVAAAAAAAARCRRSVRNYLNKRRSRRPRAAA